MTVVAILIYGGLSYWQSTILVNRAKLVRIGMTEAELRKLLGEPAVATQAYLMDTYGGDFDDGNRVIMKFWDYLPMAEAVKTKAGSIWFHVTGTRAGFQTDSFLRVRLVEGRVDWIQRGTEIIEAAEPDQQ